MDIIASVSEMQAAALEWRRRRIRIGFVPTMGFLHEGHRSLMRIARERADRVVVSIFVNPTQFGPGEDFARYPRDPDRDRRLCEGAGVDTLFTPAVADMYPADHSVHVEELLLSRGLCGASRPGHFRGVATVVAKLFNIVQPDVAVFGQKDAQQARVIQQMARDLNFAVDIVVAPIIREADGLAMSSRNKYLSADERRDALCLHRALDCGVGLYRQGVRDSAAILKAMADAVAATPAAVVDYIELVDGRTLKRVGVVDDATLAVLAVRIGKTRLIDNAFMGSGA